MKPGAFLRTLLGAFFSISLLTLGCSSGSSPTSKADAGKRDTGGGSGGSSAKGGSSGSGGSSAKGGTSGSGGSSASGGLSGSGGSGGFGGASAGGSGGSSSAGGTGGTAGTGGVGGTGGSGGSSTAGAGGTLSDGGGGEAASDAKDAPLLGEDGAATEAGSEDGGAPILIDSGAQDTQGLDSEAIDTTVVFLDAEIDTSSVDAPTAPDLGPDSTPDVAADVADSAPVSCIQQIIDAGYSSGSSDPCSSCHDNTVSLSTECQTMITCLLTSGPSSTPCTGSGSCHTSCLNTVGGSGVLDTCVTNLVNDACN